MHHNEMCTFLGPSSDSEGLKITLVMVAGDHKTPCRQMFGPDGRLQVFSCSMLNFFDFISNWRHNQTGRRASIETSSPIIALGPTSIETLLYKAEALYILQVIQRGYIINKHNAGYIAMGWPLRGRVLQAFPLQCYEAAVTRQTTLVLQVYNIGMQAKSLTANRVPIRE
jgi:hypothetical protein